MEEVFASERVALITGGASGIGLAVAIKCAGHGMRVCLADVNQNALDKAHTEVLAAGAAAVTSVVCDVTKVEDNRALADRVMAEFGEVAFLFLNAGLAVGSSAFSTPLEEWKLCLDVNVWGVIYGLYIFTPLMIEQQRPSKIVSTSSLSGLINSAPDTGIPYVVAKHSVTLIMESLQNELRKSVKTCHVSAHVLHPGIIRTGITENSRKSVQSLGISPSRIVGLTDEKLEKMTDAQVAKYEKGTFSGEQLADGLWEAMGAGKFYCLVSPPAQPAALFKALVGIRAEDIMYDQPPLSQHVPELRGKSRERLKALRAKM